MDRRSLVFPSVPFEAYESLRQYCLCALTIENDPWADILNVGDTVTLSFDVGLKFTGRLVAIQGVKTYIFAAVI